MFDYSKSTVSARLNTLLKVALCLIKSKPTVSATPEWPRKENLAAGVKRRYRKVESGKAKVRTTFCNSLN